MAIELTNGEGLFTVDLSIMAFRVLNRSPWGPQVPSSHEAERVELGVLGIPVELIMKIIELMDFRSVLSLIRANKRFKEIYDGNRGHILLSILETEMSPFDEALQIIAFEPEDIDVPLGPCLRRRIYHKNKMEHFKRLIRLFEAVKAWEQLFPRYRFQPASDCRELYPRESKRLRAALYRWTSYAQFFHGDLPRPNNFVPQHGSTDIRCKRLRLLSDHELHELDDLWETVQRMDYSISREEAERIGFGTSRLSLMRAAFSWNDSTFVDFDTNVNAAIVDTFLKLSPAEIMGFATDKSTYTRDRERWEQQ
ncbi:putative f-box domain-containing protein [Diaporthe ampelina]|uniref:Putative f-box domain-containing protein n=1 Tax=Diaporthe ampelina TaxID=1214573 RepID=A0A0G2FU09_9PEZI|nr:putative f-box domain-containing protein [Diaporthe ampelina]